MLLLLSIGFFSGNSWPAPAGMQIGQPAPPMVAVTLDGQMFDLSGQHGKGLLVNFCATWCVMPLLDEFYRRHHDVGLAVIGISVDRLGDRSQVQKIMTAFRYPAAMLSDIQTTGFEPPDGVPSTYVVDRNGVVRDRFMAIDDELLTEVVVPLLSQMSSSALGGR
jgi:peroxiredoxin